MAKYIEEYNPQKIELIKRMMEKQAEKGKPMAFEIYLDNFKVVFKTTDLAEFDSYEDLMTKDTKYLRINTYETQSENTGQTKYVFEFPEKKIEQQPVVIEKGLGEVEVSNKIKETLAVERDRWDKEQLNKELDKTKLALQEAEEYIDNLQAQIESARVKPNHLGKLDLGLLAGVALEGVMRKNPQWLTKVPGFEGLAGIIEKENEGGTQTNTPAEETEVSVKKKSDNKVVLTENEQRCLNFGKQVADLFEDDEIVILVKIINALGNDTTQLKPVAELLNIEVSDTVKK
jgi:hypothetical protein